MYIVCDLSCPHTDLQSAAAPVRGQYTQCTILQSMYVCMYVCMYVHACMNVLHSLKPREEVVEDFVRNFLVSVGLHRTADLFQAEW